MALRRLAFALVLLSSFTASVSAQRAPSEALDKGFQALRSGDPASAASIFREALTRHPRDPQLLFGAGVTAGIQGQDQDAIAFLKQALQIEPQLAQAAVILGELLYRRGDLELAIKTYERTL